MRRTTTALLYVAIVLVLGTSACAKRPAMTQASAPPPTPPAVVAPTPAPPAAPAPAAAAPAPAPPAPAPARPAPAEFRPAADLPDVYFDFDKSAIRPDAARVLRVSADWLAKHADQAVLIEGHCDERGTAEYNLALGDRRARAARDFLVANGVAAGRITLISYGEDRPQCTDRNEACWSRNRRAHFVVKPR
jgi:peptidoglycan-associated lipoprotein